MTTELPTIEMDNILRSMAAMSLGTITITPSQCDKIKACWALLHIYDSQHDYTLSSCGLKLRKDKRPDYEKYLPKKTIKNENPVHQKSNNKN
jgi:hypothetical protein